MGILIFLLEIVLHQRLMVERYSHLHHKYTA
jgi:hypothetical protein